jgi:hypothetical protein
MDEDRIEIITQVSTAKPRSQSTKSRFTVSFAVLLVFVYCGVVAAVALKPHSGSSDLGVGAYSSRMAARLLTE